MKRKPDVPRKICFQMLYEVFEKSGYANLVLTSALNADSVMNELDRSFVTAMFYGTITRTYTIDHYLFRYLKGKNQKLDGSVRTILRMGVWQLLFSKSIPTFAAVDGMTELAKGVTHSGGVGLVNAVLRAISTDAEMLAEDLKTAKFDVRFSLNKEISGLLIKWYGKEKAEQIAGAFLKEPSVTARVNTLLCTMRILTDRLAAEGVTAEEGFFAPQALRLTGGAKSVDTLSAYRDGLFMIQDEGAMMAAVIADPKPENRILDICSAPGGKTCHLAELTGDKAIISSLDIHENRLELVRQNVERLKITSVTTVAGDATEADRIFADEIAGFDVVLVDVPCSGLGLLSRKPDIRLSASYARIMSLLPLQSEILRNAGKLVRKGGFLLYCTCTVNPDENSGQVDAFLAENLDFVVEDITALLPSKLTDRNPSHRTSAADGRIQMLPDMDGCDGFFIAKMRRV